MKKTLINIEFAIRIIVILAFLLVEVNMLAQTQNVKFSKISDINGVTLGKINAMTYDSYGFLWLSDQTNRAVIRYDGSQIKRYTDNPADAVSLGGFYPECLYADTAGVMWIGYYGQGLDRLDPKTNRVTHYDHNPNDPNSLSDNFVTSIVMDSEGKIWVGNYGGVDVLDPVSGEFKNYVNNPDDENSLSYNKVRKIYKDKAGTIWIGTGFPWDENDLGGLNRYNREQDDFTRYLHDTQDPSSLIDNRVRSIFEDSRGNFWIGTGGDGLHTMDRRAGTFTRHQYDPDRPETLSRSPVYNNFDHVTSITEDSENQIWIGTQSGGIARYNPSTSTIQYFGEDMDASLGFDDNSGWWIQPGDDGLVWIATEQANLFKVELYNYTIPKLDLGTEVFNLLEDSHSKLWIGTENGLLVADGINGKPKQYTSLPVELEDMGHFFHELIEDNSGNIWIGMHNGLYRFNPNTNTGQAFRHDPNDPKSISGNDISIIYEDSDSLLWIGTVNSGLNRYDPKKKVFIRYQYQPADLSTLSSNNVRTIIQEDSEHMLIGLFDNAGLNRVNRQTGEITRFLPGLSIRDLYKDSFGEIWIGTHNGLYLQDSITNDFVALIDHNPVINIPSAIKSIVEDDQYHLWFGTIKGLYRLNAERTHLILYDEGNGVSGVTPGHLGQNCRLSDGTIIFRAGSENYVIDPMSLNSATYDIDIYFTELIIAGQEILSNDHRALQLPIIDSDDVHLKYNENSFALGVSALNFRDIGDQRVLYKMDDYDPDWRELDSGEKISYYRVPSGRYQLEVKTSNMDTGQWFNKKLNIIIANPWWAQLWAYLLYGLIILGAGRWFYHLQKARLVREEKERHRLQELEHAREIEKAYSELEVTHNNLKSTQTQLIQSEKMASLGELTAGIAHEIQNPLNFVNNFSEVNKELLLELKEEINNGNLQEVKNLANNVIDNEDKIIHHGKRAGAIVKSMLQHSRSRQGEREEVDLNELADEYLRLAYHGMRAKDKSFNADMETDFDKNLGKLKLVPQDIGRVILNLITNAFYAVHQKKQKSNGVYKPVVTVKTKQENGKVEIEVADNGIGMTEEVAKKIFHPFFTTKPTGEGTGLGLSLSYDIIKAHGGELSVDSTLGQGSKFIIEFPC